MVRRLLRRLGWTLIGLGAFLLYFLVYQLVGTNAVTSQAQSQLRGQLQREWAAPHARVQVPSAPGASAVPVKLGSGIALLEIPKIGLDRVVVEGVSHDDLRRGPGHIPGTAMPGQPGTFGVSGHRTTYGAPFYRLNELSRGDRMILTTRDGIFTYTATRLAVVDPSDIGVLADVAGPGGKLESTITLTTCNPRFSAAQRLIVFGVLTSARRNDGNVAA